MDVAEKIACVIYGLIVASLLGMAFAVLVEIAK